MPTISTVAAAIDQHAIAQLGGTYQLLFGNTENSQLFAQNDPFVKFRTIFTKDGQMDLGRTQPSRKQGSVVAIIYVRKNVGDGARNQVLDQVLKSFRSKVIGGATFRDARITGSNEITNWALTGVEIPFYFDEQ